MYAQVKHVITKDIKMAKVIIQGKGKEPCRPVGIKEYPGFPVEEIADRLVGNYIGNIVEMKGTVERI